MITVSGSLSRTAEGLTFHPDGFHLLAKQGEVLRCMGVESPDSFMVRAGMWARENGVVIRCHLEPDAVWLLRVA